MKITKIEFYPLSLNVKPEFSIVSSAGAHFTSRYLLIAIHADDGNVGWGEATVVPRWSGETRAGAKEIIENDIWPLIREKDPLEFRAIAKIIDSSVVDNPFTKAAVEMAILDLAGKKAGTPIYQLLGGPSNSLQIPIKFAIGLREPAEAAEIAVAKVKEGFKAIKLKVGPDREKDLLRVRLVREAVGPDIRINVDVNGGWTIEQSIREIANYEPYRLEYVEQPVARWDIDGMAKVRSATRTPIMADESVFAIWQAEEVLRRKAADILSVYPGKNGGILNAQRICRLAESAGVACHLGSNLEWDVGTAAMCQLAVACSNVQAARFPVDILGPLYYSVRLQKTPVHFSRGEVKTPEGAGLGLEISDTELIQLFRSASA